MGNTAYTILLVDDDEVFLEVMAPLIEVDGFVVHTAVNGIEAIKIVEKDRVDIIITDLKMPISDGLNLMEAVSMRNPDIKVIMITGFATVDKTIQAWRSGVSDFLTKPFTLDQLKSSIGKIVKEIEKAK